MYKRVFNSLVSLHDLEDWGLGLDPCPSELLKAIMGGKNLCQNSEVGKGTTF